jgi:hypothetical protein
LTVGFIIRNGHPYVTSSYHEICDSVFRACAPVGIFADSLLPTLVSDTDTDHVFIFGDTLARVSVNVPAGTAPVDVTWRALPGDTVWVRGTVRGHEISRKLPRGAHVNIWHSGTPWPPRPNIDGDSIICALSLTGQSSVNGRDGYLAVAVGPTTGLSVLYYPDRTISTDHIKASAGYANGYLLANGDTVATLVTDFNGWQFRDNQPDSSHAVFTVNLTFRMNSAGAAGNTLESVVGTVNGDSVIVISGPIVKGAGPNAQFTYCH